MGVGGAWIALLVAMQIQAPGRCPAAADVERQLAPLLPPGFESGVFDVAALQENGDGSLTLSLARFDRGTITRKRLPPAPSCGEQAETVAVALAVWEAQIHPAISLRLDRSLAAPAPVLSAMSRPPAATTALRSLEPRRSVTTVTAIGAGLAGAWQPGSLAPGGRVDATLGFRDQGGERPWRLRLSVAGLGVHTLELPPGRARWWRAYLAPGADYALQLGSRWALVAGAGGVLGMMHVAGSGYRVDHGTLSADLGVELLARVEWRRPGIRPWLGLAAVAWLRRQRLDVAGAEGSPAALARAEPLAMLGADFCWGP